MLDCVGSTEADLLLEAQALGRLTAALGAPASGLMVIGATARNILSVGLFGRLPQRGTRDVDIAVAVASWSAYERATATLRRRAGVHAFTVDVDGVHVPVDVVPYGGIEAFDRTVDLPDDHRLNVLGLREAFATAQTARLLPTSRSRPSSVKIAALDSPATCCDRPPGILTASTHSPTVSVRKSPPDHTARVDHRDALRTSRPTNAPSSSSCRECGPRCHRSAARGASTVRWSTDQKVRGSNPFGRAVHSSVNSL